MKEKRKLHWPIRTILFLVSLCLVLNIISGPFIYPYSDDAYGWTRAVYEEKAGSLDAVFIGTSNTVVFWVPLFAWEKYGIASCMLANNGGKVEIYRYLIEEARKTQPDALYVISFGNPDVTMTTRWVHWATDYMKPSLTKLRLFQAYFRYSSFSLSQKVELLLPLFCYHSRWDELSGNDFSRSVFAKGATRYTPFLENAVDVTGSVRTSEDRIEPDSDTAEAVADLLDYLDSNHVHALFLNPPQFSFTDEEMAETNTLLDMIEERGYPVMRTREMLNEFHFDYSQDYYNSAHTNIHGATKYTQFIARYLKDNYGFRNKRDDADYSSYNEAFEEYVQVVSPYAFDFEVKGLPRNYNMTEPKLLSVEEADDGVLLCWGESDGADGYLVYRQSTSVDDTKKAWECVADLKGDQLQYKDLTPDLWCYNSYTVVPYSNDVQSGMNVRQYGNFNCFGLSILVQQS